MAARNKRIFSEKLLNWQTSTHPIKSHFFDDMQGLMDWGIFEPQCLLYNFSEDAWQGFLLSAVTRLLLGSYVWICRHSYKKEGQQLINSIRQREWVCVRDEENEFHHWSFERTRFKRVQRVVNTDKTNRCMINCYSYGQKKKQSVFSSPVNAESRLIIFWVWRCQHWTLRCGGAQLQWAWTNSHCSNWLRLLFPEKGVSVEGLPR